MAIRRTANDIFKERENIAVNNQNVSSVRRSAEEIYKERGYVEPVKVNTDNRLASFAKTSGYRSAAQAYNVADALTHTKQYKMAESADKLQNRIDNAKDNKITPSKRQRMYAQAASMIDKDNLANQRESTKNLISKAAENEQRLKDGLGPVGNAVSDMGLAGADMLTKVAISTVTGIPLPVVFGIAGGAEQFQEDINEGRDINTALKSGVGSGIITGGVESLTGIGASGLSKAVGSKILSKMPRNIGDYIAKVNNNVLGRVLQGAIGEGIEEGIEYDAQRIYRNLLLDENTPRDIKEQAYSMLIGAGVGGLFGGAANALNSVQQKRYKKQLDAEYNQTINNLPEASPIHERINAIKEQGATVTDEVKLWVINSVKQHNQFESETDKLLQSDKQKETFFPNKNIANEQTLNEGQKVVKSQNIGSNNTNPTLSVFNIQNIKNPREVKKNVYEFYKNSIISDSNNSRPIINKGSGMNIEVSRATINQTFQSDDKYMKNQDNEIKLAAMASIVDLIQNGNFAVVDNSDSASSKVKYAEISGTVNVKGVPYEITMDIRRTDNGNKLFVHSISTNNQQVINNAVNKRSGVIHSEASERIRASMPVIYDTLDKIGTATNMKIKLVDTIYDPTGTKSGFANGQYDPVTNSIEIAMDSYNPLLIVAKHEITHMLQNQSPKLYKEYKDYVLGVMKANGTYDTEFASFARLYELNGLEIDKNGIDDEMVADATELFLNDEVAINELAKNNPSLGQKILDIIKGFIAKVENIVGKTAGWMNTEQLRTAEQLWVNALNDVSTRGKERKIKSSNVKFSLKDSRGKVLSEAQQEFFRDSKVRDEQGNLLVLHHGTKSDFNTFVPSKGGEFGSGIYLTDNKDTAMWYAKYVSRGESAPKTIETYVNITNPYVISKEDYIKKTERTTPNTLKKKLIKQGYDGIIGIGLNGYEKQYIAFEANQVKEITNTKPTSSDDIRYSLKEIDEKYLKAVKDGDTSAAQQMVTEYAESKGYTTDDDYRITHKAPSGKNGTAIYEINKMYGDEIYSANGAMYYGDMVPYDKSAISTLRSVRNNPNKEIIVYRAVPKNIKDNALRNGDWVTISPEYAREHGYRQFDKGYKIISQSVLAKYLFSDGGSIHEYGYNNGMKEAYQNTKNNAKLLDAVTYDDDGNIIPLSKRFNKREQDVRYQLKDNRDSKDVERLQKINERLKEQFKLTKGVNLDKNSIKKMSKQLLKDYDSKYDAGTLEIKILELYTKVANNLIEYDDMIAETQSIARDILENVSVLNDTMHKKYAELRKTLRNTAITLPDRYKNDLRAVGGWDNFRKKNLSRIKLVNDGMSVDQLYQELSGMHPELFNSEIANQADQLMIIDEVLDGLVPIYENPFDADMNEVVEYLALEIFENYTNIPEAKPTFADKQKVKLDDAKAKNREKIKEIKEQNNDDIAWLKYQNKERIKQVLEKEKIKRGKAVEKVTKKYSDEAYRTWWKNKLKENDVKSHYQAMIKEIRAKRDGKIEKTEAKYKERIGNIYESRKMREAKASIQRKVKRLDALLRKPTQKKHINKALEKSIAELLAQLDFSTDRQKENTLLRLRDLRAEYEKIAKVSDEDGMQATADPYVMEGLEMLNGKRIADMTLEELEIMYNIVSYFDHMVNAYNKAFIGGKWEEISKNSYKILDELKTDKPAIESAYDGIQGAMDIMKWGMLTPQMFFRRMGNTFTHLYDDIRDAENKKIKYTKITQDYMSELLKDVDNKTRNSWTGDKAEIKNFKLENGKTIELKPSQVMSLYLLLKREQARGHIFGLGIKAAPIVSKYVHKENDESGKKTLKKRVVRQFEPVKVTVADVQKIISTLSKGQKKVADGISEFLNTYTKQWVNETTLQNFGYELAKEENYFPIKSDDDFIKSDFDIANFEASFKSMPFTKSIIKNAGNAIIIDDIFDTFTEHANNTATYAAFLTSVENMKRVINYKTQETSIILAMRKKFGSQAVNYLKKLMRDIQGGIRVEPSVGFMNKLVRWRKRAVLGLNPRVVLQQPTSIVRASAMIDVRYLAKGIAQKGNKEEMLKYSPIAWWKSQGYFDIDTGRTMKDIILDNKPFLDNQYNAIQKADDITWTKIWNAVKHEIADAKPDLKVGSQEYFEVVSKRFSEIVDETQVVDTVLHRSDIMRRTDWSWKMATNFMSEQTKQYNLLLNAAEAYKNNPTAEYAKKTSRVIVSCIANTLMVTFIASMVDAFIDKDDEEFMKIWFDNAISDPIGMIPFVREFDSIFLFGNRRMEYEALVRFGNAMKKFGDWVNEWVEGKNHKYPLRLIVKDVLVNGAEIPGVSARNAEKYIEAVMRRYMEWSGDDKGSVSDVYKFMFKK